MRPLLLTPLLLLVGAAPAPERHFMVTSFERLRVEGAFEVEVVPGSPGATAFGDRAALDQISVRNNGDTLIVSGGAFSLASRKSAVRTLRITASTLRGVTLIGGAKVRVSEMRGSRVDLLQTGAGTLEVASIRADDLAVNLTGTGAMTLAGTALRARIRSTGAGSIDARRFTAGDATLTSESSGAIDINVRYAARATALGSGGINVLGTPECTLRGPGPIECAGTIRR